VPGGGRPPGAAQAWLAARQVPGTALVKAVQYGGYTIDVPANWPVYWLDRDPARCVRFDRNAVYLGQPGTDQVCPAHLVGRVATISLQVPPAASGPAAFPAVGRLPRPSSQGPSSQGPSSQGPSGLVLGGPVLADATNHELYAGAQRPGLSISATYGADAGSVLKIIQSVRRDQPQRVGPPARRPARLPPVPWTASITADRLTGRLTDRLTGRPDRAASVAGRVLGKGFDTCAAPSLAVMRAWRHAFSYASIYIGGAEAGCGYGNLSAAWIRSVTALGWGLMPAYAGPQAPCNRQFAVRINPARAASQGRAAARDAVSDAAALGLGRGAPVYYDMESFDPQVASCRSAVLTFLDAWTRQIHASGYVSGVYTSAATGAQALGLGGSVSGRPLAEPDSVWFADWDDQSNVLGTPYLSPSWWGNGHQRIKQYLGPHNRTVNGFTLNIDSDLIRGPVYR
jgi:hypothetical protein